MDPKASKSIGVKKANAPKAKSGASKRKTAAKTKARPASRK